MMPIVSAARAGPRGRTRGRGAHRICGASLLDRAAPARQVAGLLALREDERAIERAGEALHDLAALDAPAQEVRPQEFAERRDVLGEAAGTAKLAGERAERVVREA